MKRTFAFCCLYFAIAQFTFCQDQVFLKVFWNNVYSRYQYKEMTAGMASWMYKVAEQQTGKYSEAMALLETLKQNLVFQNKLLYTVYVQENGNKENLRLFLANMCGSFTIGNPVADYVCSKYSNDPIAKRIITPKKKENKDLKKEEEIKDSAVGKSAEGQLENEIQDAEFPGGQSAYQRFLTNNIKIPDSAVGVTGKLIVEFTIDSTGNVMNAKVISPMLGFGLDEEVLRLINSLPTWNPARKNKIPTTITKQQTFEF